MTGTRRLAAAVPWDRERVLEIAERPSLARAFKRTPWIEVESYWPHGPLPFADESFDCVVLTDSRHAAEAERVLTPDGVLIDPQGRRIWKRPPRDEGDRARMIADWLYRHVQPGEGGPLDPKAVLTEGVALCEGYTLAARELFEREGLRVRWITMVAEDVPWQNRRVTDSHEVLEVEVDGRVRVVDPTANLWYDASFADLLRDPERATVPAQFDDRATKRGYELYTGPNWFGNVKRVAVRSGRRRAPKFSSTDEFLAREARL